MRTVRLLFSASMASAVVAGRKTVTRRLDMRLLKVQPGDRLLGKETWAVGADKDGVPPSCLDDSMARHYLADGPKPGWCGQTRVSIHMPDKFVRIRATVTSVRIQRLHDITEEDARHEGFPLPDGMPALINGEPGRVHDFTALGGFRRTWVALHGLDSWQANPEVVRVEFRPDGRG